MGLGSLQYLPLTKAREIASKLRVMTSEGIDPIEARKADRQAQKLNAVKSITFRECATSYIEVHKAGWKNAKHSQQWENTLAKDVYPTLGDLSVGDIDMGLVLKVLEPIWLKKPETARRVRGRIENILDWATAREYRTGENPARWRGHLNKILPNRDKVQKVKHHNAMPYEQIGEFMQALRARSDLSAKALELIILTATRTNEVIGARWDEIDLEKKIWIIPAERMKMDREHRVPLSDRAIEVIKDLPQISGAEYLFPGNGKAPTMSNMTCLNLLKRMGHKDITVHGFRSTFRDWAAERTSVPREVAESALAHSIKDKAEAAYQRRDLLEKRRRLMENWESFCSLGNNTATVTPIRKEVY